MDNQAENYNERDRVAQIPRRRSYDRNPQIAEQTPFLKRRISWGSIFAGVLIATAIQVTLFLLPMSFGMVFLGPVSPGSFEAMSWTTAIMHIIVMGVSLFMGAYIAARLSNIPKRSTGMFHGASVWAIAVLFNLVLAGQLFSGIASGLSSAVRGMAGAASNISLMDTLPQGMQEELRQMDLDLSGLRTEIAQVLAQTGDPNLSPEAIGQQMDELRESTVEGLRSIALNPGQADEEFNQIVGEISSTTSQLWSNVETENIANVIAARSDFSDQQAQTMAERWKRQIDQAVNNFQRNVQQAREDVVQATDQAMDRIGQFALFSFLALFCGGLLALWGGFVGTPKVAATVAADEDSLH